MSRMFGEGRVLKGVRRQLVRCHEAKEVVKTLMNLKNEAKLRSIFLLNNCWQERNAVREGGQRRPPQGNLKVNEMALTVSKT
jgi:hypothetical protein